ncbi:interleukin-22 [Corvus hawaiiensis]|uniref:LOW QUALITY PROTEIN: interleukin-22 n=1 Tax=Corvus kubaryi TaxID=68294 RepID=UPI001C05D147|nr:LOW QUALITY PROTEIN: interleukin-22 [Corvus kubaryi]XP_048158429.1 interleukin-22 [Corvus hawaiiensis]
MASLQTLSKSFPGWVFFCCCCCLPLLLTSSLPLKGASTAHHACKLRKINFQQPYIRNRTYTLAKTASASDKDTDNRLIGQQLFVNIKENNRCYLMKRVVEFVVKDVLLTEVKYQYPYVEEVAQFLASLTSELSSCRFSGQKEHIEKNLEQMKKKMEQLGENGKTKAIGELDLLFDYMENACTDVPKKGGNKKKN